LSEMQSAPAPGVVYQQPQAHVRLFQRDVV
jgi:hypothetical protein